MLLSQVKVVEFPKIFDPRGNLSFLEENKQVPFNIARCYWIYDVPGGETRGGHSYFENQEIIIALSGSFDIVLCDGKDSKSFSLNRCYNGLYVPAGIWRHIENFSTNSLGFIVASTEFKEDDYERDFNNFISSKTIS